MRIRVPAARLRQVTIGLDKALNPVSFQLGWFEGPDCVRAIGGAVAPFVSFEELIVILDLLPRHVSFRDLDESDWCQRGERPAAFTGVTFDMPGWFNTGMAGATIWEEQLKFPGTERL